MVKSYPALISASWEAVALKNRACSLRRARLALTMTARKKQEDGESKGMATASAIPHEITASP
jgi:hypothetical protein